MFRKSSARILIRADASPAIGTGHMMRCLALAKAWQAIDGEVFWLMCESIKSLDERLIREGISCTRTSAVVGSGSDADQTIAEAQRINATWVVVDGYRFAPGYVHALKKTGLRVLFMDDDGRFEHYPADAVLNQNVSGTRSLYTDRARFSRLLLGPEYVLLRPEFFTTSRTREIPPVARNVLITMGGSDPENVTEKAVRAISHWPIEAKVVIGIGNPRHESLRDLIEHLSFKIELVHNPEMMAPLMRWADIAISAGGTTCWELAYMGLPAIVIASSHDQDGLTRALQEQEIALNLGWHANLSEDAIRDALISLLPDYRRRVTMSERGRKLIDGQGATRVVEFLQNSL